MNNNIITKEEVAYLSQYERTLFNALYKSFATGVSNDMLNQFADIVDKYKGKVARNYVCNICKLKIIQKCGELFFESRRYYEKLEKDNQNIQNNDKPRNKPGRKKKGDNK